MAACNDYLKWLLETDSEMVKKTNQLWKAWWWTNTSWLSAAWNCKIERITRSLQWLGQRMGWSIFRFDQPKRTYEDCPWIYDSDTLLVFSAIEESLFNFNEADDDENLRKLEEQRKEKSAALHTTGIIMALCAGALYGIQSIIGKSLTRPLQLN